MPWSVGFLILMSACFPSANLQDVYNDTKLYKRDVDKTLNLDGNSLSITVPLGGDDELTFTPIQLLNVPSSVSSVIDTFYTADIFAVNAVFPMLLLQATCDPGHNSDCTATIMPFNYTANFVEENSEVKFTNRKVENPNLIEVVASITLSDELADKKETAQSGVAQEIKEAITKDCPGALLAAIEDAFNKSFIKIILS